MNFYSIATFWTLSDKERLGYYIKRYINEKASWKEIADDLATYANKVRRDALFLGLESRDKSEAQKVSISEGRHEHPTRGKAQSDSTKRKISESQGKVWDELSPKDREYRSKIGIEAWKEKTGCQKTDFFKKSGQAIQKAARNGSKAEHYLEESLTERGYRVETHKEQVLKNEKFHIDLYIPDLRIAIEVDGPMHFKPVFGKDKLQRRQAADLSKNGLILSAGMLLIRVQLNRRESQRAFRDMVNRVMEVVNKVEEKFPNEGERYFEV